MSLKNGYLAIALMGGLAVVGCSNTAAGAKKDAEINAEKAAVAADEAKDKAAVATEEAKDKAAVASEKAAEKTDAAIDKAKVAGQEAADVTKETTREAGAAAKAAGETVDIKSALMADKFVDASHINVDTNKDTKTVVLKGSVKTSAQRDKAVSIARDKAPGYRVDNQLTIVPNP